MIINNHGTSGTVPISARHVANRPIHDLGIMIMTAKKKIEAAFRQLRKPLEALLQE